MLVLLAGSVTAADFDRDGRADFAVFRPSSTTWMSEPSNPDSKATAFQWGHASDVLVPSDYDADGQTDFAVWRPENGVWYIHQSGDDSVLLVRWGITTMHPTGGSPDVPVPADYDGDGETDLAVWRPDTGEWWIVRSANGYDQNKAIAFKWGKLGDVPVQADYDGDGKADYAVFRPSENRWFIRASSTGKSTVQPFGLAGLDTLVPADYTGDKKADVAVYRSGVWYVINSTTAETEQFTFGFSDDVAVPADYDGDGTTDFAVYRGGTWYVNDSSRPRLRSYSFGQSGDVPVNSGVVRQSIVAVP
ncbi:MAG: VCBS repeat-containing protein [Pyrinomonadaceae bacterium]